MNIVLAGYGEIGKAVHEVFGESNNFGIIDPKFTFLRDMNAVDILVIAFPYSDKFEAQVRVYQERFDPLATVIFSTVPIGTCSRLGAVHSPVEGKHPDLAESIRVMTRWVGGYDRYVIDFLLTEFTSDRLKIVSKPEYTEFLKMASTSLYGINIEFARYRKQVADELGMDYELVKEFDEDYNRLYSMLGFDMFRRYILDPPDGNIGGHCVVPNSILLYNQFPHMFLAEIFRDKERDNGES